MHKTKKSVVVTIFVVMIMVFSSGLVLANGITAQSINNSAVYHTTNKNIVTTQSSLKNQKIYSSKSSSRHYNATSVLNQLKGMNINEKYSYLPNMHYNKSTKNGLVQPGYRSYPAPMGIGDFGLNLSNGHLNAYNLTSSSIEGSLTLNSTNALYPGNSATPHSFSIQLNAVLNNVTVKGISKYVYWTQNVAFYSTRTHQLTLIDNIWNFTSPSLPSSTIYSGNGISNDAFPTYYYDVGPTFTVNYPFTLSLYLDSTVINGRSALFFNYSLNSGSIVTSGSYDEVVFNSTYSMPSSYSAPSPQYLISGNTLTPTGLLNDAEFILGGPGGGSTTTLYNLNGAMNLKVLSKDGTYKNVPSSYDYGTDTGETSEGVAVAWNSNNVAALNTGPSFLYGMWNASSNSKMQSYSGAVTPSNSFVFVSPGSSFTPSTASWVPIGINGKYSFRLPSNTYSINVSLSDHTSIVSSLSSSQSFTLSSSDTGLYTPLYAMSNSQLSAISSSGTGTVANQYRIFNNSVGFVGSMYSVSNDFGFRVFFGVMLNNISDYTSLVNETVMVSNFGFGFGQALSDIIIDSSNVSVIDGTFVENFYYFGVNEIIAGDGYDEYSFMNLLNDTHVFLGANYFAGWSTDVYIFNGTGNMIWGNELFANDSYFSSTGLDIDSSGNTIYNNYFWGLFFDVYSFYCNSIGNFVENTWNIANQSASNVNIFNGYSLSGSIIGTSYQGGNYWWDYTGQATPFNDYCDIPSNNPFLNPQGDNVPLVANYVHFIEHGLPSNLSFCYGITFNHTHTSSRDSSNEITLNVINGSYTYSVPEIYETNYTTFRKTAEFIPSVSSGTLALSGSSKTVDITYTGNYLVNFTESGLPTGTTWYVNLSTGSYSSKNTYINAYLPNDTYSYTIATPNKDYSAFGGTFTVNGNPHNAFISFKKEVFKQIFEEQGLPPGTAWNVIVDGTEYSTTSSSIPVSLVNGSYTAQISSPANHFPTPSKLLFIVQGQSSTFPVAYAYSSNKTYVNPVETLYPSSKQTFSGSVFNVSAPSGISINMAYDSEAGLLFIPELFYGQAATGLYVYNTVTGKFVNTISGVDPYEAIYNQNTGMVYSMSLNGNLTEINPSTMLVVKNLTLPVSAGSVTDLQEQGNNIYALSSNGNLSIIDASTFSLTKTVRIGQANDISPFFAVYRNNAFIVNPNGDNMIIVNLTTSALKQIYLPRDYTPESVINYYGSTLLIGGENYTDMIYNTTTGSLNIGPSISGIAISIVYDKLSHMDYISSVPFNGEFGNITVIDPTEGKIMSRIPGISLQFGMVFDQTNQNIYTTAIDVGVVSVYSVQHYYRATFTETGLPSGTAWYVNLTNGMKSGAITGTSYSFELTNESYSYTIATSNKIYGPSASYGKFTVKGANVPVSVTFSPVKYSVAFTETGLPSGSTWYVNGTGISGYETSPTNIIFMLTNGTYTFTITNLASYYTTTSHFTVHVNGNNVRETVLYYHWAYITGTLSPDNATLILNGKAMAIPSSGHFNISVASGTYHLVASEKGYATYYSNFTLNNGKVNNLAIDLKPVSKPSTTTSKISSISSTEIYAIVGIVAAIAVVGGIVFMLRKRK